MAYYVDIVKGFEMETFECLSCGELVETDNEDDLVSCICEMCQEFGEGWEIERGDIDVKYCNCEDYPCCGH